MGLLLFCETVESTSRKEPIPNFDKIRREAVHAIFSIVDFGLGRHVSLDLPSPTGTRGDFVSLIRVDPYPHHVVASLQLAVDVLLGYLAAGSMTPEAIYNPCKIAARAMEAVPQCSASVHIAKAELQGKLRAVEKTSLMADDRFGSQAALNDLLHPKDAIYTASFGVASNCVEIAGLERADHELADEENVISVSDINSAGSQFLNETLFPGNAF
jgi:hypothetical protein